MSYVHLKVLVIFCLCSMMMFGTKAAMLLTPGDSVFVDAGAIGGIGDGSSWENAFANLQDGIAASSATDTIFVAEGIYYPDDGVGIAEDDRSATFDLKDSVYLMGGFQTGGTGVRDYEVHTSILSGSIGLADSTDNSFHVVRMIDVSSETCLDGFVVEAGNANGDGLDRNGGGFYHTATISGDTSAPVIRNCVVRENSAQTRGGGMYNSSMVVNAVCLPTLYNCRFINNDCLEFDGGAIFNSALGSGICKPIIDSCEFLVNRANAGGAIHSLAVSNGDCSPQITNCIFHGNVSTTNGGAVHTVVFDGNSYPEIRRSDFSANVAGKNGGALYSYASTAGYEILPIVDSCDFSDNRTQSESGGAVMNWSEAGSVSAVMMHCSFRRNQAVGSGGAVMNYVNGVTSENNSVFQNCVFSENRAAYGGACENFTADGVDATQYIQCLFEKDTAEYGAGLDVFIAGTGDCSPLVLNCIFSRNVASESGGGLSIFAEAGTCEPLVLNGIFWENEAADSSAGISTIGALSVLDYCLVDTNNCAGLGEDGQICGTNMIYGEDPKFEDADNSDYALRAGSPGIDQGQNNKLESLGIIEDFVGGSRIFNDVVDLGILESNGMPSFCDDTIRLSSISIPNALYHARLNLIIDSSTVESTSITTFRSGNCIEFQSGFEVVGGSAFEAGIEDCEIQAKSNSKLGRQQHQVAGGRSMSKLVQKSRSTDGNRRPIHGLLEK